MNTRDKIVARSLISAFETGYFVGNDHTVLWGLRSRALVKAFDPPRILRGFLSETALLEEEMKIESRLTSCA